MEKKSNDQHYHVYNKYNIISYVFNIYKHDNIRINN